MAEYDYKNHSYESLIGKRLPPVVEAIVERTIIYFAELLYSDLWALDPQKALNRILLSDVGAGTNVSLGDAIEYLKEGLNHRFPFTVYQIADPDPGRTSETNNQHAALGLEYFPEIGSKIATYPSRFEINFVSFFNRSLDYHAAYTLLGSEASSLTRLYAPIMFGDVEVEIPFDVSISITRGTLANAIEEWLVQNRIWGIVHTVKIDHYEYLLDNTNIYPVDNMFIRLAGQKTIRIPGEYGVGEVPDPLSVVSTYPEKGAIEIDPSTVISIEFSEPPIEESVVINVYPDTEYDIEFVDSYLNITPRTALSGQTRYDITVFKEAMQADEVPMLEDYEFSFFTI